MDTYSISLWFGTVVAGIYGLLIGSFLNVCIYRLPPRVFCFDDVFYDYKKDSIITDITDWWKNLFNSGKKKEKMQLQPFLYAETLWSLPLIPESAATAAVVHGFNLYKENFPDTVTIVKPRSFCPNCRNMIQWWMNIPVLSYLFLGGKCHYCKVKISPRYMINELISGFLCGSLFYIHGMKNFPTFIFLYTLAALCLVVFYIDLDNWLILDEITIPFTLVGILGSAFVPVKFFTPVTLGGLGLSLFNPSRPPGIIAWFEGVVGSSPSWLHPDSLVHSFFGSLFWFLMLYSIAVIGTALAKREAMGGGDIKFAMLMGAFLGAQKTGLAFFLAVLIGTLFMLPMLLLGKKTGKDQVPFGCFLTIATIITIYFGDSILLYYFNWPVIMNGNIY